MHLTFSLVLSGIEIHCFQIHSDPTVSSVRINLQMGSFEPHTTQNTHDVRAMFDFRAVTKTFIVLLFGWRSVLRFLQTCNPVTESESLIAKAQSSRFQTKLFVFRTENSDHRFCMCDIGFQDLGCRSCMADQVFSVQSVLRRPDFGSAHSQTGWRAMDFIFSFTAQSTPCKKHSMALAWKVFQHSQQLRPFGRYVFL